MVAARHLHNRGLSVQALLIGKKDKLKDVPKQQWETLRKMKIARSSLASIADYDLIIDAMIGYGLEGDPRPPVAEWIDQANLSGKMVLALDAPSGLDSTSGRPGKPCIAANATLTLALPKTGLIASTAKNVVGELYLADISVPIELYKEMGLEVSTIFKRGRIKKLR